MAGADAAALWFRAGASVRPTPRHCPQHRPRLPPRRADPAGRRGSDRTPALVHVRIVRRGDPPVPMPMMEERQRLGSHVISTSLPGLIHVFWV